MRLCAIVLSLLLSIATGCKKEVSGSYLGTSDGIVTWLQLVRTSDGHVTGQFSAYVLTSDGRMQSHSVPVTGAAHDHFVTLDITSIGQLSGVFDRDKLELTGTGPQAVVMVKADRSDYEKQVQRIHLQALKLVQARAEEAKRKENIEAQARFASQTTDLVNRMTRFLHEADAKQEILTAAGQRYETVTAIVNHYVEREAQLAKDERRGTERSQLEVAATQASLQTDRIQNEISSLQTSFESNIEPLARRAEVTAERCDRVGSKSLNAMMSADANLTSVCPLFLSMYEPFKAKSQATQALLDKLAHTYLEEERKQQVLLRTAQKLE